MEAWRSGLAEMKVPDRSIPPVTKPRAMYGYGWVVCNTANANGLQGSDMGPGGQGYEHVHPVDLGVFV